MLRFTIPCFVVLSLVVVVRKALRDYGAAAEAVDERSRENDADNAMFTQLKRDDSVHAFDEVASTRPGTHHQPRPSRSVGGGRP